MSKRQTGMRMTALQMAMDHISRNGRNPDPGETLRIAKRFLKFMRRS